MVHTLRVTPERPALGLFTDLIYTDQLNDFRRYNIPLRLHLIRPYGLRGFEERLPLFLWAEGGACKSSAPASRLPELSYYACHGWAVASVQYRTSNQSVWPAQIQDLKTAVRFVKSHADQLGIDPDRIVLGGESAGAHLTALAALTGGTGQFQTGEWPQVSDAVRGAICWYCAGDSSVSFPTLEPEDGPPSPRDLLLNVRTREHPESAAVLSAVNYVTKDAPPFLFLHGDQDPVIPWQSAYVLHQALAAQGGSSAFYLVEGGSHASAHFAQAPIQQRMLEFMKRCVE